MPNETKKLVDLQLLGYYDGKIKNWTSDELAKFDLVQLQTPSSGAAASYELQFDGTKVGVTIDVPDFKDYFVQDMDIKTCTVADDPIEGLVPGDKYFDITINTEDGQGTAKHVYLAVEDAFPAYSAGDGIDITSNAISAKTGVGLEINATSKNIDLVAQSSDAGAPAIGGVTTADYAGFKGAADTFAATAGQATAGTATGNVTPYTQTVTVASTDVGGTETADAFHFDLQWKEYGNATPTTESGGSTVPAAAGLMSGTDKDNLDALVDALGTDLNYATNSDIDALFA